MKVLAEFTLPIMGLKFGEHEFDFVIGREFFSQFEASPVTDGDLDVHLVFDKHSDMMLLDFDLFGTVKTECDRCLAPIDLPIEDSQRLIIKFSEEISNEEESDEVVFIHPETTELNVARYVYEFIVLAIPMIRTIEDCENEPEPPCDFETLNRIQPDDSESTANPFKDAFNGFGDN